MNRMNRFLLGMAGAALLAVAAPSTADADRKLGIDRTKVRAMLTKFRQTLARMHVPGSVRPQPVGSTHARLGRPIPPPYTINTGSAFKIGRRPTIVFLPGAGQPPKNGVLERLAGGMSANGVATHIVSLPSQFNRKALEEYLAEHPGEKIIIAGHSAGGAAALRAANEFPSRIVAAIVVNPAAGVGDQKVPTLLLRGTNDGYNPNEGGHNVTAFAVQGGDHSLRHRDPRTYRDPSDKAAAEKTPETVAMNREVGRQVGQFLRQLPR